MAHTIDFQNFTNIQNNQSSMKEVKNEKKKKFLSSLSKEIGLVESQPDPDFFQDNNTIRKKNNNKI